MIYSEITEKVYSELIGSPVHSQEEPDYRVVDFVLRVTEEEIPRETEEDNNRILE